MCLVLGKFFIKSSFCCLFRIGIFIYKNFFANIKGCYFKIILDFLLLALSNLYLKIFYFIALIWFLINIFKFGVSGLNSYTLFLIGIEILGEI